MSKILDQFSISKYTVLKLDEIPLTPFKKIVIDGVEHDIVPSYDMPNCIAIESGKHIEALTVDFV